MSYYVSLIKGSLSLKTGTKVENYKLQCAIATLQIVSSNCQVSEWIIMLIRCINYSCTIGEVINSEAYFLDRQNLYIFEMSSYCVACHIERKIIAGKRSGIDVGSTRPFNRKFRNRYRPSESTNDSDIENTLVTFSCHFPSFLAPSRHRRFIPAVNSIVQPS